MAPLAIRLDSSSLQPSTVVSESTLRALPLFCQHPHCQGDTWCANYGSCLSPNMTWSEKLFLRSGIESLGDPYRLERLIGKLRSGHPVTITAIGSSVVNGYGGAIGSLQMATSVRTWGRAGMCRDRCFRSGWLTDFFYWLNAT